MNLESKLIHSEVGVEVFTSLFMQKVNAILDRIKRRICRRFGRLNTHDCFFAASERQARCLCGMTLRTTALYAIPLRVYLS